LHVLTTVLSVLRKISHVIASVLPEGSNRPGASSKLPNLNQRCKGLGHTRVTLRLDLTF